MATALTFAVPVNWSDSQTYERNMIVFVGKKAYTAIQDVPTGIAITNTSYWIETGVPSIDLTAIQNKLNELDSEVSDNTDDISQAQTNIIANANDITALTSRLNSAVSNLETQITRLDNVMITLYTPVTSS